MVHPALTRRVSHHTSLARVIVSCRAAWRVSCEYDHVLWKPLCLQYHGADTPTEDEAYSSLYRRNRAEYLRYAPDGPNAPAGPSLIARSVNVWGKIKAASRPEVRASLQPGLSEDELDKHVRQRTTCCWSFLVRACVCACVRARARACVMSMVMVVRCFATMEPLPCHCCTVALSRARSQMPCAPSTASTMVSISNINNHT